MKRTAYAKSWVNHHERLQEIADYVRDDGIAVVTMNGQKLSELERLGVNKIAHQILPISAKGTGGTTWRGVDLQQRINHHVQQNDWWLLDGSGNRIKAWGKDNDFYIDVMNADYRNWLVDEIEGFLEEFRYTHLLLEVMPVNVWMGQFKGAPLPDTFKPQWDDSTYSLFRAIMNATPDHYVIVGGDTQAPIPAECDALMIEDFGNRQTQRRAFDVLQNCNRTSNPNDCIIKMDRNDTAWDPQRWWGVSEYYAAMTMVCSDATFCIDAGVGQERLPIRIDADAWDTGRAPGSPDNEWRARLIRRYERGAILVDTQNQDVSWEPYPTDPPEPPDNYVAKINTLGPFMMDHFTPQDWSTCTDIVQEMARTMTMEQILEVMGAVK